MPIYTVAVPGGPENIIFSRGIGGGGAWHAPSPETPLRLYDYNLVILEKQLRIARELPMVWLHRVATRD